VTPVDAIDCVACEEDLSALIDGELAAGREALLRDHLAGCARCGARLAALRAVDAGLAALPAPAVPEDLRARLEARIAAADVDARAPGRAAPPRRRRWLATRAWGALAAAGAAIALYLAVAGDENARLPAPAPEPQVAQTPPAGSGREPAVLALDAEPADDLAVALDLDTVEDLEVIANLELLQALAALDEGTG
jgi:anti-sigma factor RsiW